MLTIRLPAKRPPGLRLHLLRGPFYRIDAVPFSRWAWEPHEVPQFRFDSAAGRARVRYAATASHGAARERYRDTGHYIPPDHAGHYLVTLTGDLRVLDLRRETTLDALGLDDRVSTGHEPEVWKAAQELSDLVHRWWSEQCHGIAYRPRTRPETSLNLAFFAHAPLEGRSVRLNRVRWLREQPVVGYGFTIDF
ncbi:MAG: RES domain-containing protein [Acidimicrobiia bacterium]